MKISTKKILTFAILPAAVLLFSGCGFKSNQSTTPKNQESKVQTEKQSPSSTRTDASTPLPTLPADNKQAIDSEIQGIDQSINSIDASTASDKPDAELGL